MLGAPRNVNAALGRPAVAKAHLVQYVHTVFRIAYGRENRSFDLLESVSLSLYHVFSARWGNFTKKTKFCWVYWSTKTAHCFCCLIMTHSRLINHNYFAETGQEILAKRVIEANCYLVSLVHLYFSMFTVHRSLCVQSCVTPYRLSFITALTCHSSFESNGIKSVKQATQTNRMIKSVTVEVEEPKIACG